MSERDVGVREVRILLSEVARANEELSRLISGIRRIYYEANQLLLFLRLNPELAAAMAVLSAGIEVYTGFVAEQARIEERQKQTQRIIDRYEAGS